MQSDSNTDTKKNTKSKLENRVRSNENKWAPSKAATGRSICNAISACCIWNNPNKARAKPTIIKKLR